MERNKVICERMALLVCLLSALLASAAARADDCANAQLVPTTPDSDFQIHNFVVTDKRTGLMWWRCPLGQPSTIDRCYPSADTFSWQDALKAADNPADYGYKDHGHDDWRLPSVKELYSLVEHCRENPSINTTVFPDTPGARFWTSSPHANENANASSAVHFSTGKVEPPGRTNGAKVRLVRTVVPTYDIGDTGPAGGIVFYDKGNSDDGWRYLAAAPAGWDGGEFDPQTLWGCNGTSVGATGTGIGDGEDNTAVIAAAGCSDADSPAVMSASTVINGYDDWFLPSVDALDTLHENLSALGNIYNLYGFGAVTYASSSEINENSTWGLAFGDGGRTANHKTLADVSVRPIRAF